MSKIRRPRERDPKSIGRLDNIKREDDLELVVPRITIPFKVNEPRCIGADESNRKGEFEVHAAIFSNLTGDFSEHHTNKFKQRKDWYSQHGIKSSRPDIIDTYLLGPERDYTYTIVPREAINSNKEIISRMSILASLTAPFQHHDFRGTLFGLDGEISEFELSLLSHSIYRLSKSFFPVENICFQIKGDEKTPIIAKSDLLANIIYKDIMKKRNNSYFKTNNHHKVPYTIIKEDLTKRRFKVNSLDDL